MSTKRASTRIPVFGLRIPVPISTQPQLTPPPPPPQQSLQIAQEARQKPHEITSKDVGKKVRVADKEGILRFVGNVQFSTGTWCGVELTDSVGKHDGTVRGIRYFACPATRGLMAPLAKVSLVDEIAHDAVSGPYSMIFGVNDELPNDNTNDNTFNIIGNTCNIGNTRNIDNTYNIERSLIRSNTFDKEDFERLRSTFTKQSEQIKTQITCDTTIVNQSDSIDGNNETVINISITNRGRVFNISSKEFDGNQTRSQSDLAMSTTVIKDNKAKIKVPSELNLSCNETIILKHMNESFERPRSYPITENYSSTPVKSTANRKSLGLSPIHKSKDPDEDNKRDSLDCDESLGILTPDQMNGVSFMISRSPSSENIQSLPNDPKFLQNQDTSIKDFSLLDINQLSTFLDTTMNMELPLDTKKTYRIEQTPSPEELPLDPTPVVDLEPKTESTQSKTTSNFITSITSITSIDTGYQGDGEMSRPASRGADNSPLTRRPLPRVQPRRPDPMTDSDFYTESDADNHEDHDRRGDRKAQVIDGTLYGAETHPHAEIYVTNRENMDSSGVFTDLESNKDNDNEHNEDNSEKRLEIDVSPSDSSTKTISDNSQNNSPKPLMILQSPDSRNVSDSTVKEMPVKKMKTPMTTQSSVSSSPRRVGKEDLTKKYKTPKRNVPSKVKAVLESGYSNKAEKKTPAKKAVGRWDAVMNKISKGQGDAMKNNLKEVKSKVFTSISTNVVKTEPKEGVNGLAKQQNNKLRRLRARPSGNSTPTKNKSNIENSINSSLSDLSGASPAKSIIGSAKKQREVVRVTQVLTAAKLSPKPNNRSLSNANDAKKISSPTIDVKATNKRNLFNSKEKKKEVNVKECNRTTNKGGRVSPGTRPPPPQRVQLNPAPRTAEALAVLVQHLVFNLEAFRVPHLKKEVDKVRLDAEEARLSYQQIEDKLLEANARHASAIEEERTRFRSEISTLIEQNRTTISQLKDQHAESERKLKEQVQTIAAEYSKLQKAHSGSMDILREENDAIREEIDEKNALIDKLQAYKHENEKVKKNYKEQLHSFSREVHMLKDENEALLSHSRSEGNDSIQEVLSLRAVLDLKQSEIQDLRKYVVELSQKADMLQAVEEKVNTLQAKCEDLTSQLDRKNLYELQLAQEKKKLEESLKEEANQKRCLVQRNEELQWKIQQNKEVVTKVIEHAEEGIFNRSLLSSSFSERHSSHRYNLERTLSLREKPLLSKSTDSSRKSKNSYDLDFDDISPPTSPKVKGVVEKSDSVSYVLEMDESPDVVASRIVRRSFRNTTPPKNTPTKSPSNKRPRIKTNPLSLSASASAIMSSGKTRLLSGGDYDNQDVFLWDNNGTSTPLSNKEMAEESSSYKQLNSTCKIDDNIDIDEDLHLQIPSLPSEIGRNDRESLPTPRHLAGEAMIFESNSDDESTTSSSSGQL